MIVTPHGIFQPQLIVTYHKKIKLWCFKRLTDLETVLSFFFFHKLKKHAQHRRTVFKLFFVWPAFLVHKMTCYQKLQAFSLVEGSMCVCTPVCMRTSVTWEEDLLLRMFALEQEHKQ